MDIDFFCRMSEYSWLSNYYKCEQVVDGRIYPSNEHYYQSQKANTKEKEDWILSAKYPHEARQRGKSLLPSEKKANWKEIKVDVMLKGLRAKFKNPELRAKLISTGDAILHEDSPTDMFWGKKGKDMLGKLIMKVRSEILIEDLFGEKV